jgi:phosphohistidine swiveling domain-containing protein
MKTPPYTTRRAPDVSDGDPMHHSSLPTTTWTTANVAENIPGVMTPLGADVWYEVVELWMRGSFAALGVLPRADVHADRPPDDSFTSVFFGRSASNADTLRRIMDLMPGASGADFEQTVHGMPAREGASERLARWRHPLAVAKSLAVFTRLPWTIRTQTREVRAWWRAATSSEADRTKPASARLIEAKTRAARALTMQALATYGAQGMIDRLAALADEVGCSGLRLTLVSGHGATEEAQLVSELYRIARHDGSLEAFLAVHGARCPGENEISARSWREDRSPLDRLIAKYAAASSRTDPAVKIAEQVRHREEAERLVLARLPRAKRASTRLLFALGKSFIPLREEGKASLAMAMDATRAAARARGRELEARGELEDAEDVFYLTLREATTSLPPDVAERIAQRKRQRARYAEHDLPQLFIGNPEPVPLGWVAPLPSGADRVRAVAGVPGAPGIVEGTARVVHDPEGIDEIEPDEILVCRTTDPSWACAFHLVSAAVIDIGGPASHGAIVARELGLPCVINTKEGTRLLRTGDRVRVDGAAGTVSLLAGVEA